MSDLHPHYRRNFASLVGDWVFFVTGMAFVSYTTVIPSFVNQLTDFAPLIGLAATIPNGVWLLPQLIAAKYVGTSRRKKPWVIGLSLIGRPMYIFVGLTTVLAGNRNPWLLLAVFFFAETVFSLTDGLSSVAWFDVLGKVIPARRRGRFYSTAQTTTGLLSMAVGVFVARVLGPGGPSFPQNYGLLFCSCSALLLVSLASFLFVKEPVQEVQRDRESWGAYLPRLSHLFAEDEQMRTINMVRLLVALGGLALPFYVVHATDVVGVGNETVGLFVSAQMLGSVIASLAMGYLNERSGSRVVSQLTVLLSLSSPILALAVHYAHLPGDIAAYVYALVFLFIGGSYAGYMQGFMNFVLDIAPLDERPAYVGLYNTLGGTVVFVAPLLGGWLLETTSYPVLFTVAIVGTVAGLLLSVRLKEPRLEQDRQR
ncbi:MAG TPA: MFS transporter [Anaerolineae bacterium]|nr:MFS transporter [Anaerolineae bacterium]